MERWANKVAVVTGSSSGIGAACSTALLEKGMIVVGLARRLERMETELRASLPNEQQSRFHAIKCDVTKEEEIVKAFEWIEKNLGGVDVLVNNAGVGHQNKQLLGENNSEHLRTIVDTNILGVAFCTLEAFRSMKKRGVDGHVVNINSILGHNVPTIPGLSLNLYPCTKHALTAMTEVLRQEFLNNNTKIKVSSVSPGRVDTEIRGSIKSEANTNKPMLRSQDVADAVVYVIQTPPNVQIHELIIKPLGEPFL